MSTFLIIWFFGGVLVSLHYFLRYVRGSKCLTVNDLLTLIICMLFSVATYLLVLFEILNDRFGHIILYRFKKDD